MTTYRQYKLEHDGTYKVCWLDRTDLQVGWKVQFKKEDDWWEIVDVYDTIERSDHFDMTNQARDYLVKN